MPLKFKNMQGIRYFYKNIVLKQRRHEQDALILVTGMEGSGKSNEVLNLIDCHEKETGEIISIDSINFTLKDFLDYWANVPPRSFLVLDEGKELQRKNFADADVKDFENLMTRLRSDSNIYIICITNPIHAIRYIIEDKVCAVFRVTRRKKIEVYSGKDIYKMMKYDKDDKSLKKFGVIKPRFTDTSAGKYRGHLAQEYLNKKEAFKNSVKLETKAERENRTKAKIPDIEIPETVPVTLARKLLRCHDSTIRAMCLRGELRYLKTADGKFKPYKEDIYSRAGLKLDV